MSTIQTFHYREMPVEFESIDGQLYANATAMCKPFGKTPYEWVRSERTARYMGALRKNPEATYELVITRNGGESPGTWIHEKLILKLAAWLNVDFEIWCDEKVSELLRTGAVTLHQPSYQIVDPIARAQRWIEEEQQRLVLAAEKEAFAIKAEYADLVLSSASELTTTLIAKELSMSAQALNKLLHSKAVQFKQGGVWVLYQKYADQQLARLRTYAYSDTKGQVRTSHYLVWTETGRWFIHKLANPAVTTGSQLMPVHTLPKL